MTEPARRTSDRPPTENGASPETGVKAFLRRWGRRVWWLHSFYALGLGVFVMGFAQKGLGHARWLAAFLAGIYVLLIVIFRIFGSGGARKLDSARGKLGYYTMTYVLKNCYQGMLFFCLPFYWRSTTLDHVNVAFLALLGVCAVLSTMDVIFDRVLMRWRAVASVFYAISLFAAVNLVVPALLPQTRSLYNLLGAAGLTCLAFWTLHARLAAFKNPWVIASFVLSLGVGVGLAYVGRRAIPPVPLYVTRAGVGPDLGDDGRLRVEVVRVHRAVLGELHAVTDVALPGGDGELLRHAWYHEDRPVSRPGEATDHATGSTGELRLHSKVEAAALPETPTGRWRVDTETEDGQLVGRLRFEVFE